jgi:hypothetical protein
MDGVIQNHGRAREDREPVASSLEAYNPTLPHSNDFHPDDDYIIRKCVPEEPEGSSSQNIPIVFESSHYLVHIKFEALAVVTVKNVDWDVTPYSLIYALIIMVQELLYAEAVTNAFLRNVGKHLTNYTTSNPSVVSSRLMISPCCLCIPLFSLFMQSVSYQRQVGD